MIVRATTSLIAAACGMAAVAQPISSTEQSEMQNWIACADQQVAMLDDGKSSAELVVQAALFACRAEREKIKARMISRVLRTVPEASQVDRESTIDKFILEMERQLTGRLSYTILSKRN